MDKRKNLAGTAFVVAVAAITAWVVFRGGDWGTAWAALRRAKAGWLCLGVALSVGFVCFEAVGTVLILRVLGRPTPMGHCLGFSAVGFYFSAVTPSATGGQPAQVFYMARRGVPAALGTLDMLLLTMSYQAVSVVLALTAWAVYPQTAAALGTGLGVLLGWSTTANILLTVGAGIFLFRPGLTRGLCRWAIRLGERLRVLRDPDGLRGRLEEQMAEYRRGAELVGRRWWLFAIAVGATAAQLLCRAMIPWAAYRAFGLSGLGPGELAATQVLVTLAVGALPIPGTVGASEAAFLAAFRPAFGAELVPAAMVLCRGLSFYLPLVWTAVVTAAVHLSTRPGGKKKQAKNR